MGVYTLKKPKISNKLNELLEMGIQSPPGRPGHFWYFYEGVGEWVEFTIQDEVPTGRRAPINWGREHI